MLLVNSTIDDRAVKTIRFAGSWNHGASYSVGGQSGTLSYADDLNANFTYDTRKSASSFFPAGELMRVIYVQHLSMLSTTLGLRGTLAVSIRSALTAILVTHNGRTSTR